MKIKIFSWMGIRAFTYVSFENREVIAPGCLTINMIKGSNPTRKAELISTNFLRLFLLIYIPHIAKKVKKVNNRAVE